MNQKEWLQSINEVDDRFIEEAETKIPARRRSAVLRWASAAACLAVACAILMIPYMNHRPSVGDVDITAPVVWNAEKGIFEYTAANTEGENHEIVLIHRWEERQICEKYAAFEGGTFAGYNPSHRRIDENDVGEELETAVMTGYDVYTETTYRIGASVYALENVDSSCAVCVKYEGEEGYYVFFNADREFVTLGEFLTGFGLRDYLVFRNSFSDSHWRDGRVENGLYQTVYYRLSDLSSFYGMLFSDLDAKCVEIEEQDYMEIMENSENSIGIAVDCLSTGQENIGIQIFDDGYLITNIGGSGKVFEIGSECAEALIRYIRENGEVYDTAVYDMSGDYEVIPNTGDMPERESSAGYAVTEESTRG